MKSEHLNLLCLFQAENVDYVAVVDYTVIAHGFPRTTSAIDILVQPTAENAVRYISLAALRKAKAATGRPQDLQHLKNSPSTNLTF